MRHEFDSLAEDRCHAVDGMFHETAKLLRFTDNVFLVGPPADSPEFAGYVRSLKTLLETDLSKHLELHGLTWVPKVPRTEVAAYERAAQELFGPDFRIREPDASASQGPGAGRADCFPSYLSVGKTSLCERLGEDLAAESGVWEVMQRARDTGTAVATGPMKMSADADGRLGYRVFQPLYSGGEPDDTEARRRAIAGFLCLDLDVGELVESALKDIAPVGIEIAVGDDTDARPVTVCRHSTRVPSPSGAADREASSNALESTWPTDFFGRKLALRCGATEAFYARRTIWQPWVLLCGGLALTFAGVGHQISRALRACAIERAVTTRLAAIQHEFDQRRQGGAETSPLGDRVSPCPPVLPVPQSSPIEAQDGWTVQT